MTTPDTVSPTEALLDHLDQLRAKATPGPWAATSPRADGSAYIDQPLLARDDGPPWVGHASRSADAALIVAAVNAAPKLTAALRAVLALAEQMDSSVADLDAMADRARARGDLLSEGSYLLQRAVLDQTVSRVRFAITTALASPAPAPHRATEAASELEGEPDAATSVAPARVPWLEQVTPDSCGHTAREGCNGHGDF